MKDIFKKLNYIFTKKQKIKLGLLLVVLSIGAALELAGVSLIMPLISLITDPKTVENNATMKFFYHITGMQTVNDFFVFLVGVIIAVYVVKNIFLIIMYYVQYNFIYNNQLKIAGRLIDCYLKKPYTYHLDKNSSEMVRNIMLDTERLFQLILSVLSIISEGMLCVFMGVYLLASDPEMTITVGIVLVGCTAIFQKVVKSRVNEYGKTNQKYDGKMHQSINQALGAVKDIKILHREKYFVNVFVNCGQKKMKSLVHTNFLGQVPKYLIETVCVSSILLVIVAKLRSGTDLSSILPQLAAFAMAAFKLLPSVGKINNYANLVVFLKPSIDLIYHDLKETEDMVHIEIEDKTGELHQNGKIHAIHVEGLSYAYPNTNENVLTDVNFEIPLGASIGLVGPSGAGKSTIADIILGILTPSAGHVYYGDMDVHEHPIKWSQKLAYIPQAIYLADETIRNNVAFGIEDADIDEEMVWKALEEAQLKEFVEGLEHGLDTEVGERGVRLSGGQRQRIGIARALYGDPEILVLDEATSALDNDTEKAVMEAIERLHGKKTLIIIAHRLTTIKNCEIIYKVENGKIFRTEEKER